MPQIEVTFDIDANGILNVKAQDKGTGREQSVTITASSTLSKDEVERLVREAETNSADDRRKREEVETRNQSDSMLHQAERVMKENEDRIPADLKAELEQKMEAVREAAKGSDTAALRQAMDSFNESLQKIGEHIYKDSGPDAGPDQPPPAGAGAGGDKGKGKDDVVDADYREVN